MELHTIHNPEQNKILRAKCKSFDFAKHDNKELKLLITEMRKKMHAWHGVGLAATQIGINEAFFVAQTPNGKFYAIFNPRITKTEKPIMLEEGCLSVPDRYGEINRFDKIVLEGQDKNGKPIKVKAWGLLAQVFQHETDHLQGVLYTDKAKRHYKFPESERLKALEDAKAKTKTDAS